MANGFKQINLVFLILTWGLAIALFPLLPTIAAVWPHGEPDHEPRPVRRRGIDLDDVLLAGVLLRNSGLTLTGGGGGGNNPNVGSLDSNGGGSPPPAPNSGQTSVDGFDGGLDPPVAGRENLMTNHARMTPARGGAANQQQVAERRVGSLSGLAGATVAAVTGHPELAPLANAAGRELGRRVTHEFNHRVMPNGARDRLDVTRPLELITDLIPVDELPAADLNAAPSLAAAGLRGYTTRVPIRDGAGQALYHEGSLVFPDEVLPNGIRVGDVTIPWGDLDQSENQGGET